MKRIIAFLILSIALMLAGCKSPSKLVTETTNHSTKIERSDSLKRVKERQEKDSIHIKDSTIIIFMDSIKTVEHWHTQFKYKNILVHDTIYQKEYLIKTDTLYTDKVKEVVKYKTPSEALWVIVVLVVFCIILVFAKFKN